MNKTWIASVLWLAVIFIALPAQAEFFGPDSYGYTADSDANFLWEDMTASTDTLVDGDDDNQGPFPIGFDFEFYGVTYTEFYACSNGWISFVDTDSTYPYPASYLDADPYAWIGAFAGDRSIRSENNGTVTYKTFGTQPNRYLVVEFKNLQQIYFVADWMMDVQVILFEGTNQIKVQYDNMDADPFYAFEGIQSESGDHYLNPSDKLRTWVTSGQAIQYNPGNSVGVTRNLNVLRGHAGETYEYQLSIANDSGATVTYDLSVANSTWTTTLSTSSLAVGAGEIEGFTVEVEIPSSAVIGDMDTFDLTVDPQSGPFNSGTRSFATYVSNDGYLGQDFPETYLQNSGVVLYDGKVYSYGGESNLADYDNTFTYDIAGDSWTTSTGDLPGDVEDAFAGVIDGKAYVYNPDTGDLYVYDYSGMSWSTVSGGPTDVDTGDAEVYDGILYLAGAADELHAFDPSSKGWTVLTNLPEERSDFSLVAWDGKLYVMGGEDETDGRPTEDVFIYDIATDSWSVDNSDDPSFARYEGDAFVVDGLIYQVGGYDSTYDIPYAIPVYNTATGDYYFYEGEILDEYGNSTVFDEDSMKAVNIGGYGDYDNNYPERTWLLDICSIADVDFSADAVTSDVGDTVTFTSNDPGTAPCNFLELEYDFGDGDTGMDDPAAHEYANAGVYTVTLSGRSVGGEFEVVKTDYITVNEVTDDDDDTTDDDDDSTDDDDSADDDDDDTGDDTDDDDTGGGGGDDDDDDGGCCG